MVAAEIENIILALILTELSQLSQPLIEPLGTQSKDS